MSQNQMLYNAKTKKKLNTKSPFKESKIKSEAEAQTFFLYINIKFNKLKT